METFGAYFVGLVGVTLRNSSSVEHFLDMVPEWVLGDRITSSLNHKEVQKQSEHNLDADHQDADWSHDHILPAV